MVSLPPFIDSQIFTLVLNSHPTMSRNTAAPSFIADQMTARQQLPFWSQSQSRHKLTEKTLWLCIALKTVLKFHNSYDEKVDRTLDKLLVVSAQSYKLSGNT